ncbi:MAG: Regulatory protein RecX [Chlamydiia bacterium]|nr:Regulatory protein RecX [Chlamydiia bacterium]
MILGVMMKEKLEKKAFNYACYLLGIKDYYYSEIKTKLEGKEYPADVVEGVLGRLSEYGYLDDGRLCMRHVLKYLKSGFGVQAVRSKLFSKVSRATLDEAMAQVLDEEGGALIQEGIVELYRKKRLATRKRDGAIRYLMGRGYSYSQIQEAIGSIESEGF